jgi:hypothetical protein
MRSWSHVKMKGFVGPSPLGQGQGKEKKSKEEGDWNPERNRKRAIPAIGMDGSEGTYKNQRLFLPCLRIGSAGVDVFECNVVVCFEF